jgi:hypothetical protein
MRIGSRVRVVCICGYLASLALRREIHEGLQVVEQWNSANSALYRGHGRRRGRASRIRSLHPQLVANLHRFRRARPPVRLDLPARWKV